MRLYSGEAMARYGFGSGHPYATDRLGLFLDRLARLGLDRRCRMVAPVAGCREDALLFHTEEYVARVERLSRTGEGLLDPDTPAFAGMAETTLTIVGSVLDALERILSGDDRLAFAPIAGLHHARRDAGAGFCVFNDCAIAIEALRRRHGVRRIAYVDIDAHHGDGVFYAFEEAPEVIVADLHEDGRYLYPGTGAADETGRGAARGCKLNIPLRPGAGDADFLRAWREVETFLDRHDPQFILFQCGVDSLFGDPLTDLALTPRSHRLAAHHLARRVDGARVRGMLTLGGGGYNGDNIAAGWCAVVEGLLKAESEDAGR